MQYRVFNQNLWLFPDIYRIDGADEGEITLVEVARHLQVPAEARHHAVSRRGREGGEVLACVAADEDHRQDQKEGGEEIGEDVDIVQIDVQPTDRGHKEAGQGGLDRPHGEEIPAGQELIKWVKTSFDAPVGTIKSAWDTTDGFTYECTVPVASTLYLPILTDADTYTVNGESKKFADGEICSCGKTLVVELEAGHYIFKQ